MPNTIVLTPSISSDRSTITIADDTTYTNPVRSGLSVTLTGYKVNFRGEEDPITLTPDGIPTVVTEWTFDYDQDGHYRFYYEATPDEYTYNKLFYTLASDKRGEAAIDGSVEQDLDAERNKNVDTFRLLDIFVEGMIEADAIGEYNQGERIARRAEAITV